MLKAGFISRWIGLKQSALTVRTSLRIISSHLHIDIRSRMRFPLALETQVSRMTQRMFSESFPIDWV